MRLVLSVQRGDARRDSYSYGKMHRSFDARSLLLALAQDDKS